MKLPVVLLSALAATMIAAERDEPETSTVKSNTGPQQFTVVPIGRIEREAGRTLLRLEARYQEGLLGLEQWSHLWVFYWFDQNDTPAHRATLRVQHAAQTHTQLLRRHQARKTLNL